MKLLHFLFAMGLLATPALAANEAVSEQNLSNGTRLLTEGKLEAAEQALLTAVQVAPRSIQARMTLGGVQIARNEFSPAIATYKQVISLDPNNAKAFIALGIAYLHGGDKSMTRAAFEEAMRIEPRRKAELAQVMAYLDQPD